jgi:hypothetical protein
VARIRQEREGAGQESKHDFCDHEGAGEQGRNAYAELIRGMNVAMRVTVALAGGVAVAVTMTVVMIVVMVSVHFSAQGGGGSVTEGWTDAMES